MNEILKTKISETIWVAKSLFERGKTTGTTANISFRYQDQIYISGTGTCFGKLKEDDFAVIDMEGRYVEGKKPSKEYPLHLALYHKTNKIQSVIHTHSFYSTLWSCIVHDEKETDCIPTYTPYLRMKLGTIGMIPYEKPGTEELFAAFEKKLTDSEGYLLKNHGPIVGGSDIMDAFSILEELEESAKIAWELRSEKANFIL